MEPIGMILGVNATRDHALSARPHAPVVSEPSPRWRGQADPVRLAVATALRRLADRVQPRTCELGTKAG